MTNAYMAAGPTTPRQSPRRRFACTVSAVLLVGALTVPSAIADPDPGAGAGNCGDWNDTGGRFYLWDQVKKRTPANPDPNLQVVFPDPARDYGYAVHNGAPKGTASTYDLLLLPTNRISGIECPKLWAPNALNLWQYARDAAHREPSGTNIILGVNSAEMRDQDQLHIHVSRIWDQARTDINNQQQKITSDPTQWRNCVIRVLDKDFRALHVPDLNANPFVLLQQYVAPKDMAAQTLVVTPSPKGGYDLLNSQWAMGNHGVRNIEFLMNKKA